MELDEIKNLLGYCQFSIMGIKARFYIMTKGDGFLLQVGVEITDFMGKPTLKKGGKHYISSHAIPEEIVQKALKACLDFTEHEAREGFTFKGQALYHQHYPLEQLHAFNKAVDHAKRVQSTKSFSLAESF